MLLKDFKSIGVLSGIGMEEFIPYLQDAYEYVINKLRLDIGIHHMTFDKACKIEQFNSKASLLTIESEIAFKEMPVFMRTNEVQNYTEDYVLSIPVIGEIATNDEVPEIFINGSEIVCINMDQCYVLALGYIYPYLVTTLNGYKIEKHYYDLQTMITAYGFDNLYIDNVLVYLCGLKIMSLISLDNGSISEASNYDYLLTQMLNTFNRNTELIQFDTPTIDQGVVCH
jgi:hypothetical protein